MSLLCQLLNPKLVRVALVSLSKEGVIRELLDIMQEGGVVHSRADIEKDVLEREEVMSTGLHNGIALPHCESDAVSEMQVVVALKKEGVEFGSLDGQPARIFFCIASPHNKASEHIKLMSEIGRLARVEDVRNRLLDAATPEQIVRILSEALAE